MIKTKYIIMLYRKKDKCIYYRSANRIYCYLDS